MVVVTLTISPEAAQVPVLPLDDPLQPVRLEEVGEAGQPTK